MHSEETESSETFCHHFEKKGVQMASLPCQMSLQQRAQRFTGIGHNDLAPHPQPHPTPPHTLLQCYYNFC